MQQQAADIELRNADGKPSAIGGFPVLGELGVDPVGPCYLAEHPGTLAKVFLQVFDQRSILRGDSRALVRRLQQAGEVRHANLARIHDIIQTEGEGLCACAYEHASGQSMDALVAGHGRIAMQSALHVCLQVAEGLAAAHAAGIVHGDLRPNAITITRSGAVKIRLLGVHANHARLGQAQSAQRRLELVGHWQWASPEQLRRYERLTPASDVHALGLLLHYMLSGTEPRDGSTVLDAIVGACAAPVQAPAGCAPHVAGLLEGMLAVDPALRYPDASAVVAGLHEIAAGREPERPSGPRTRRVLIRRRRRRH